jgi:hypothetical protein
LHKIHEANQEAVNRIVESDPVLLDVLPAKEVIPVLSTNKKVILHSGSPLTWPEMSGAMKGKKKLRTNLIPRGGDRYDSI